MIALCPIFMVWTTVIAAVSSNDNDCLVDIVFVIDGSSSIGRQQFQSTLKYVEQLTNTLAIRPDAHRVALLEYSGRNRIIREYGFGNFTSVDQFKDRLLRLPQMLGTTFTARALERVLVVLNGRRPEAQTVVVTVTDGFSYDDPTPVVAKIAALGTNLFSFNVNKPFNQNDLLILANGIEENVFHLPNAVEDAKRRLDPYLRCDSNPSNSFDPVAFNNCSASAVPGSKNVDKTLKEALTDLRDREKVNASEAIVLFTNSFSCDYPDQHAKVLRDQAVHVISLNDASIAKQSGQTVASVSSQMLVESINALLGLLREQYCKLQEERLQTSTTDYGSRRLFWQKLK